MDTLNPEPKNGRGTDIVRRITFEELANRTTETLSNAKHHYYRGMMRLREFLSEKDRPAGATEGSNDPEERLGGTNA